MVGIWLLVYDFVYRVYEIVDSECVKMTLWGNLSTIVSSLYDVMPPLRMNSNKSVDIFDIFSIPA